MPNSPRTTREDYRGRHADRTPEGEARAEERHTLVVIHGEWYRGRHALGNSGPWSVR